MRLYAGGHHLARERVQRELLHIAMMASQRPQLRSGGRIPHPNDGFVAVVRHGTDDLPAVCGEADQWPFCRAVGQGAFEGEASVGQTHSSHKHIGGTDIEQSGVVRRQRHVEEPAAQGRQRLDQRASGGVESLEFVPVGRDDLPAGGEQRSDEGLAAPKFPPSDGVTHGQLPLETDVQEQRAGAVEACEVGLRCVPFDGGLAGGQVVNAQASSLHAADEQLLAVGRKV